MYDLKRLVRQFLPQMACLFLFTAGIGAQGIEFFDGSWDNALERAKTEDKVIFVDAYTVWCGPCKKMAKNVFTQEAVGTFYNSNFINVKMDMEKSAGLKFQKKYPVRAYPTLFWIDGNGEVVHKVVGGQKADGLIKSGQLAINKANPIEDYAEAFEAGERDPEFLLSYVKSLNKAGKSGLKIANDYLNTQDDLTTEFNLEFILESIYEVDSRIFELFETHYAAISKLTDDKVIKKKVAKASRNTAKKGVDFEMEELVDLAITKMKKYSPKEADEFEIEAKMNFYRNSGDSKSFIKYADQSVKKTGKNNAAGLYAMARKIHDAFPADIKALKKAESYASKASAFGGLAEYYLLHAEILYKIGDAGQALAVAKQSMEIAKDSGTPTIAIEQLIYKIQQG